MKPRLSVTVDKVLPRSNWRLNLWFHLVRTAANAQIVSSGTVPDPTEATSFWSKIWSEEVDHDERASWLEDVEVEFSTTEVQEDNQHHCGGY